METNVRDVLKWPSACEASEVPQIRRLQWLGFRILFLAAAAIGATTGVGAYLLSPFYSYCLFGNLRFWRYVRLWPRLIGRIYYFCYLSLKGEVIFSIPYSSPPQVGPDLGRVALNPEWKQGSTCGDCSQCCRKLKCPLLDKGTGRCISYNSLFWRYFNCGRFPSTQREIDVYACPKWVVKTR